MEAPECQDKIRLFIGSQCKAIRCEVMSSDFITVFTILAPCSEKVEELVRKPVHKGIAAVDTR